MTSSGTLVRDAQATRALPAAPRDGLPFAFPYARSLACVLSLRRAAKFLVGKDGTVLSRYAPTENPEAITGDIQKAINGEMKGVVASNNPFAAAKALFK